MLLTVVNESEVHYWAGFTSGPRGSSLLTVLLVLIVLVCEHTMEQVTTA